jgi:hypothetical protein
MKQIRLILIILVVHALVLTALSTDLYSQESGPMRFKWAGRDGNCSFCEFLSAEGTITSTTPDDFQRFLDSQKSPVEEVVVAINSKGGDLIAALRLGEKFRSIKARVYIGTSDSFSVNDSPSELTEIKGECYSGCAYAFLGGTSRIVPPFTKYGVHQFYKSVEVSAAQEKASNAFGLSAAQVVNGILLEYVIRMGVDPRLVSIASLVPEGILILKPQELRALRIDNSIPLPDNWRLVPWKKGVQAIVEQMQQDGTIKSASVYCKKGNPIKVYLVIGETLSTFHSQQDWMSNPKKRLEMLGGYINFNSSYTSGTYYKPILTEIRKKRDGSIKLYTTIELRKECSMSLINPVFVNLQASSPSNAMKPLFQGWYPLEKEAPGTARIIKFALTHCID